MMIFRGLIHGYIPACAGEARRSAAQAAFGRVHPRVCGGSGYRGGRPASFSGTSPRVRGKRDGSAHADLVVRYIPACAGEAGASRCPRSPRPVHPRVCGGSLIGVWNRNRSTGTSPRVRGKPPMKTQPYPSSRYIPACAGEAGDLTWTCKNKPVHPRVCGGSESIYNELPVHGGSSPRVRGKP